MIKSFDKINSVKGELDLEGDKSISHRAVIFSAMASGKSSIENISRGEDVKSTLRIMAQLGAKIKRGEKRIIIEGMGFRGFKPPETYLDCGNSGTSARLIAGLLAAQNFSSTLIGDPSLSVRPMKRVIEPLRQMGAEFITNEMQTLPLTVIPAKEIQALNYLLQVQSAQVKSSVLIAGLHSELETQVTESTQTRNHTELMLGLPVRSEAGKIISSSLKNYYPENRDYYIPGDISTSAFHIVLALLSGDSELIIKNVSLNPTRTGFLEVLKQMGAEISVQDKKISSNEEYGSLVVRSSRLKNTSINPALIPNIIDEIPILTVAGILAEGVFEIRNAKELRVKESDRISSICFNLKILGLEVEEYDDGFRVSGGIKNTVPTFESFGDHRIAMSFAVLSLLISGGGKINGFECVNISNPQFENQIRAITS